MPKEIVKLEIYPRGAKTCDNDCPYFVVLLEKLGGPEVPFCELFQFPLKKSVLYKENYIAERCKSCIKFSK